jgi:hypothetical protein
MYAVPWAIADPDAVVEAITEYIDQAITRYMTAYLDDTDPLVWNIFQAAYRASVFPVPVSLTAAFGVGLGLANHCARTRC